MELQTNNATAIPKTEQVPPAPPKRKQPVFLFIIIFILFLIVISVSFWKNSDKFLNLSTKQNESPIPSPSVYQTSFRGSFPSNCGYTIGWPTTIIDEDPYQEWTYEEIAVTASSFRGLAPASLTSKGVLQSTTLFKKQTEKFIYINNDGKPYQIAQPGLVSYCVNNADKWSLEDFVKYVLENSNDQLKYTIVGNQIKWGEINVQEIQVEGILHGGYVKEPFYLSVIPTSSEYSRLVIFQPWAAQEERLETDRMAMINSLSERDLTSELIIPKSEQKSQTSNMQNLQTSCTRYKIYEGEFASDKCYLSEDLADLKYYLKQYNNAIFDQNAATRSSQITCNGSTFFQVKCDEDKKRYEQALKDQENYKIKIKKIIAKGK